MKHPAWATPRRQQHLVELFHKSRGFCVFGHPKCPVDDHHYEVFIESVIGDWKAEDMERRNVEWKLEQRTIHIGELGRFKRRFDPVARDVFANERPEYYLVGLGVGAFTFRQVALVRIPSTYNHLFVDMSQATRPLSRNKRRKIARYGAAPPADTMATIQKLCQEAVRSWWTVAKA